MFLVHHDIIKPKTISLGVNYFLPEIIMKIMVNYFFVQIEQVSPPVRTKPESSSSMKVDSENDQNQGMDRM